MAWRGRRMSHRAPILGGSARYLRCVLTPAPVQPPAPSNRRSILAWAFYDVANSSFTTLIVTFIYSTYFTGYMAGDGRDLTPVWTMGVSLTAVLVALLSPILGAIADRGGYRKRFLLTFSAICVVATAALAFMQPGMVLPAMILFVIANVAFEMGGVFYDSFLPKLAPPDKIGRVSGLGWGLGYVGGIAAMLLALYGFVKDTGLSHAIASTLGTLPGPGGSVRATNLLVAVWFAIFTLPFILYVREPGHRTSVRGENAIAAGFRQLAVTFRELRRYRQIIRLIVARLVYNDGLVVIFSLGAIFAQQVYSFTTEQTIVFGIVLNIAAGIGALVFGMLDDRIGGRNTILISLVGLVATALLAVIGTSQALFWTAAIGVGLLVGPNQAASRSLLGRFVPKDKETEFFGFFAFSGKATAFFGPFFYGALTSAFGTHRAGMSVVLVMFVVGGLLLLRVNEAEGVQLARESSAADNPAV